MLLLHNWQFKGIVVQLEPHKLDVAQDWHPDPSTIIDPKLQVLLFVIEVHIKDSTDNDSYRYNFVVWISAAKDLTVYPKLIFWTSIYVYSP